MLMTFLLEKYSIFLEELDKEIKEVKGVSNEV